MRSPNILLRLSAFLALTLSLVAGCATTGINEDPLKYTKKLVAEGHATLYNNGAFEVPNTSIKLIPPAPDALSLAGELAGLRARQSLELSLQRAAESVTIVAEGTKHTYQLAKSVHAISSEAADAIDHSMTTDGKVLVYKSTDLGKTIIGRSWDMAGRVMHSDAGHEIVRSSRSGGEKVIAGGAAAGEGIMTGGAAAGEHLAAGSIAGGARIAEEGSAAGDKIVTGSLAAAKELSASSIDRAGKTFRYAGTNFVKGYAVVPSSVKRRASRAGTNIQKMNPISIIQKENAWRTEWSDRTVDLLSETISGYGADAAAPFKKAGKELTENYKTQGVNLSVLKSLRWVLQGLLWDATIKPAAKTTGAALGYLSVNFVAFPTMVVMHEGASTVQLAVQVTRDTAKTGYDIIAPTAISALAGVLGVADMTVSHSAAAATAIGGPVLGYGEKGAAAVAGGVITGGGYVASKAVEGAGYVSGAAVQGVSFVAGETTKGVGYVAGQTVQYIGVPLTSAGIAIGGGTIGTAVGVTGVAAGGSVVVAGKTGAIATNVFGNVLAGTTLAAGTAVSAGGGAAYGVYQLSKAVVVPTGYELGSGMVLSYEATSQLAAQSVLAVSDCAYLVLSLEGPRWVIYAVRGRTHDGSDMPTGAVVDLKQMQEQGEEMLYLPVSDEEMKKVVEVMPGSLPEINVDDEPLAAAPEDKKEP